MRYVQLRAFHYVAKYGGFSRAARVLNLTQPAISDQVRKLELQYDMLLFNRKNKAVILTADGENLLEITNRLFEIEQQAQDLLNEHSALNSGTLRIMADSAYHLTDVLPVFRKKYPNVHLSLSAGNTSDVMQALLDYRAEIGVLADMPAHPEFQMYPLGSSPIVAFTSRDFGAPTDLSLKDLKDQPLVLRETGSKTRQKLEDHAKAAGTTLPCTFTAEGRDAVREVVATGAGIGFVSLAEFGHDSRLMPISVKGLDVNMQESLISLRGRQGNRLIKAFMQLAAK